MPCEIRRNLWKGPPVETLLALLASLGILLLAGCRTDAPTSPPEARFPTSAREIRFKTQDGVTLVGHLSGGGQIGVILAHMFNADEQEWQPFAKTLVDQGYTVLTFNFRGYPPSQGRKEILKMDHDITAALDYLQAQGVQKVFLIGASMGGTASLKAAASKRVSGVLTLSPPAQLNGLDALAAVSQIWAPVYFIAAEDDGDSPKDAARLYEAAETTRSIQIFQGNEHGTALLYGRYASFVQQAILTFLKANTQ